VNATAGTSSTQKSAALPTILTAGLVCGALDITAALVVYGQFGLKPQPLLQGIAAGLLGESAFEGGYATAALGLVCHFIIAFLAAAVFYAVSRKWSFLVQHAAISGPLYGVAMYFFMQLVVLPLSNAVRYPFTVRGMVIGVVIHIFCVGLPIALVVRRFSNR
jgi:uncharacterized membrane protein YagU involved in acid resistance